MGNRQYKYKGISQEGLSAEGTVEAADEYEALVRIRQTCKVVMKITPKRRLSAFLSMELGPRQVNFSGLSMMASQFSFVLRSGIPLAKCVRLIGEQMENRKMRKILREAEELVTAGWNLADSLQEADPEAFPPVFLETIRAGERSGTLDRSFERLAAYYGKQHEMKQKIATAMIYPSFVLATAAAVVTIVMVKVIPALTGVFAELDGELPLSTKLLIGISDFFQNHLFHGIIAALAAVVLSLCYVRTEKGRVLWNRIKLKSPVFGKIRMLRVSGQFAHTMSTMLSAGLTLPQSLEATAKTLENYMLAKETIWMAQKVWEGYSLGDCMWERNCYPDTLKEVCALGEETGELEEMLKSVGKYFDSQTDYAEKKMMARLEPALLTALAFLTGFIVISIYLPLFTMYGLM